MMSTITTTTARNLTSFDDAPMPDDDDDITMAPTPEEEQDPEEEEEETKQTANLQNFNGTSIATILDSMEATMRHRMGGYAAARRQNRRVMTPARAVTASMVHFLDPSTEGKKQCAPGYQDVTGSWIHRQTYLDANYLQYTTTSSLLLPPADDYYDNNKEEEEAPPATEEDEDSSSSTTTAGMRKAGNMEALQPRRYRYANQVDGRTMCLPKAISIVAGGYLFPKYADTSTMLFLSVPEMHLVNDLCPRGYVDMSIYFVTAREGQRCILHTPGGLWRNYFGNHTSWAMVVIVVLAACVVAGLYWSYRRSVARATRMRDTTAAEAAVYALTLPTAATPGSSPTRLSEAAIASIPCITPNEKDDDSVCAICLQSLSEGKNKAVDEESQAASPSAGLVKQLPSCGHIFHAACLDAWLRVSTTCPTCRANVEQKSECESDS